MKNKTLLCKKYNYAIPENYGSSNVILRYNKESDRFDIYNVDHLVNNSTKDDADVIYQYNRTLYKLDKQSHSIDLN